MTLDSNVKTALDNLISEIKKTDCYSNYEILRQNAEADNGIRENILRTRNLRDQINNLQDYEKDSPKADMLIDEYDNLCDITAVHEFSVAEHSICELYQKVMAEIAGSFDLDL